jgi:hypothetical protein
MEQPKPTEVICVEVRAGLARAFERVASDLGMTTDELAVSLLTAHLGEYERLAAEVVKRRDAG